MKMSNAVSISFIVAVSILLLPIVNAVDDGDILIGNFELEKILNLLSAILAITLSVLTYIAFSRNGSKRLLYVTFAFLFFAIKGILISLEIFFGDWSFVDPVASILDFVILFCFFAGILRK